MSGYSPYRWPAGYSTLKERRESMRKLVINRAVDDIDWQHVRKIIDDGLSITHPQLLSDLLSLVDWRLHKEGGAG